MMFFFSYIYRWQSRRRSLRLRVSSAVPIPRLSSCCLVVTSGATHQHAPTHLSNHPPARAHTHTHTHTHSLTHSLTVHTPLTHAHTHTARVRSARAASSHVHSAAPPSSRSSQSTSRILGSTRFTAHDASVTTGCWYQNARVCRAYYT